MGAGAFYERAGGHPHSLLTVLLDNAVKYCDDGGTVRLDAEKKGRQLMLGFPIPVRSWMLPSCRTLFDPFYRADSSRSRKGRGYGISPSSLPGR